MTIKIELAHIKPAPFLTMPPQRQSGWIAHENKVAFVIRDKNGTFRIRLGHICSWPGSHGAGLEIDNVKWTIVWSDVALRPDADHFDDQHEKKFAVNDPMLFRLDEISHMRDGRVLKQWFKDILTPHEIIQIQHLLKLADFGRAEELEEILEEQRPARLLNQLHDFWRANISPFVPSPPRPSRYWGGYQPASA